MCTDSNDLETLYRAYISTLNSESWSDLPNHLAPIVIHNDTPKTHSQYRQLVLPSTTFSIRRFTPHVEKREVEVQLDITTQGRMLYEEVRYRFNEDGKIERVWSHVVGCITSPADSTNSTTTATSPLTSPITSPSRTTLLVFTWHSDAPPTRTTIQL